MLLGLKSRRTVLFRYLVVGAIAGLLVFGVWLLNPTWTPDMRLWKAFGGASFALAWFALFIGPAATISRPLNRVLSFRREAGVWFVLIGLVHAYLILDGWVRWNVWEFFGYEYFLELDMYLRVESGFGVANLVGILALGFGLALAATSFDRAVTFLGTASWKWLHTFAYVVIYLGAAHVLYFAFIHFTPSLQRVLMGQPVIYPTNSLQYVYLVAIISIFAVQVAAFIRTVHRHRVLQW